MRQNKIPHFRHKFKLALKNIPKLGLYWSHHLKIISGSHFTFIFVLVIVWCFAKIHNKCVLFLRTQFLQTSRSFLQILL